MGSSQSLPNLEFSNKSATLHVLILCADSTSISKEKSKNILKSLDLLQSDTHYEYYFIGLGIKNPDNIFSYKCELGHINNTNLSNIKFDIIVNEFCPVNILFAVDIFEKIIGLLNIGGNFITYEIPESVKNDPDIISDYPIDKCLNKLIKLDTKFMDKRPMCIYQKNNVIGGHSRKKYINFILF